MYTVAILLSMYSSFFFLLTFQCFTSVLMFSGLLPIIEKTMILSKIPLKYDVNTRLLKTSVDWEKKMVLVCASQPYTLKLFGPYPKQLGIHNSMCNFLKASLLCKFVTNFYFLL